MQETICGIFFLVIFVLVVGDTVMKHVNHFMQDINRGLERPIWELDPQLINQEPVSEPKPVVFKLSDEETWHAFDKDEFMAELLNTKVSPESTENTKFAGLMVD